ncbi:MAG: hypothetical protein C0397_09795 [Odoribacter sp.]|nr:hypothetical protein [Odoribacter sp.]
MNEIIKRLESPEECMKFVDIYTELANQARLRAIELRAKSHPSNTYVETELYKVLYAYEDVLSKKNGKKTRASRTWQMVRKYGIIGAAERAVNRDVDPQGYKILVEMRLEKLTFEQVIVDYPNAFGNDVVNRAKERLNKLNDLH